MHGQNFRSRCTVTDSASVRHNRQVLKVYVAVEEQWAVLVVVVCQWLCANSQARELVRHQLQQGVVDGKHGWGL